MASYRLRTPQLLVAVCSSCGLTDMLTRPAPPRPCLPQQQLRQIPLNNSLCPPSTTTTVLVLSASHPSSGTTGTAPSAPKAAIRHVSRRFRQRVYQAVPIELYRGRPSRLHHARFQLPHYLLNCLCQTLQAGHLQCAEFDCTGWLSDRVEISI